MAIERKILREHGFVLSSLRDRVDDREVSEHVARLTAESRGLERMHELADCMELHDVSGLTGEGIRDAARLEADRPANLRGRLAILVPTQLQYGLARMYQAVCEPYRAEVRVFLELEPVLAWLGMTDCETEIRDLLAETRGRSAGAGARPDPGRAAT